MKFKRKEKFEKPWDDPNYDPLRPDKKRLVSITDEEMFRLSCLGARQMEKLFGRKSWMDSFIDENGNDMPYREGLIK